MRGGEVKWNKHKLHICSGCLPETTRWVRPTGQCWKLLCWRWSRALRPDADAADARLNWLAAAVGFLRYTQITAARDRAACTFAGTVAQNTDGSQKLRFAELLVQAYENLCHALLEEKSFLFLAVA